MRGHRNTAKRLAWVGKTYPEDVYLRTAALVLSTMDGGQNRGYYPRELPDMALSPWGAGYFTAWDYWARRHEQGLVFQRRAPDPEARSVLRQAGSPGIPTAISAGRYREAKNFLLEVGRPEGAAFWSGAGGRGPNQQIAARAARQRADRLTDLATHRPFDPLIPWIAGIINRQVKSLERASKRRARGYGLPARDSNNLGQLLETYTAQLIKLRTNLSDLADWFHSQRPQLPRDPDVALRASQEWHASLQRELEGKERALVRDSGRIVKRWSDKWTLREIGPLPDAEADITGRRRDAAYYEAVKAMDLVGDMLGHCYGSEGGYTRYARMVEQGDATMYTLFTPQGVPKVSIFVEALCRGGQPARVEQMRGAQNDLPDSKYYPKLRSALAFIFGYKPKDAWQHLDELGEASVALDVQGVNVRQFMGQGEEYFEQLFQPIHDLPHLVEQSPKLRAMDQVLGWCGVNKDQRWLRNLQMDTLPASVDAAFVLQARLIWLGADGKEASHHPTVVPTRKLVARVVWDMSKWEESNWDYTPHYSEFMRVETPGEVDEDEWEDLVRELHERALEEATSKAWEGSFGKLERARQSLQPEFREWTHWVNVRGEARPGARRRQETTMALVLSKTLVTNFTNKFVRQVEAHGELEEPFKEVVEEVGDAVEAYTEKLRYLYWERFTDLMEELEAKTGQEVITRLASGNRVARKSRARHYRGASITRKPSRPRTRRRRSNRRVPRWP